MKPKKNWFLRKNHDFGHHHYSVFKVLQKWYKIQLRRTAKCTSKGNKCSCVKPSCIYCFVEISNSLILFIYFFKSVVSTRISNLNWRGMHESCDSTKGSQKFPFWRSFGLKIRCVVKFVWKPRLYIYKQIWI